MCRCRSIRDEVVSGHSAFWPEVLERFPDITVCLENTYEPHPALFRQIMKKVNHPRLRVCLDVAHANVFSEDRPERWFRQLGPWIEHMHWNDNRGDRDNHLAIGDGTVRWSEVWEDVATCAARSRRLWNSAASKPSSAACAD